MLSFLSSEGKYEALEENIVLRPKELIDAMKAIIR